MAKNQLKALVTDVNGNTVQGVPVVFSTGNGAQPATLTVLSDASGAAVFDVSNTTAGVTTVTAVVNGSDASRDVTFIADEASATIIASVLDNGKTLTPADGTTNYKISILVKDRYNNELKNYSVTVTSPVLAQSKNLSTDVDGKVTTDISSLIAGSSDVLIASTANPEINTNVTLKYSIAKLNLISP